MKYKTTDLHSEMKKSILANLKGHPNGVTKQALQKKLDIIDPSLEENRSKVFKMVSAIVNLQHEGFVKSEIRKDEIVYTAIGLA